MSRRITLSIAAAGLLLVATDRQPPQASDLDPARLSSLVDRSAEACLDDALQAGGVAPGESGAGILDEKWPPGALGGEIDPVRSVYDPFPTFDGLALDPVNDRVVMSDENRHGLLAYDRTAGSFSDEITEPVRHIFGPLSRIGFAAGVAVDPKRKELYTVNNDGGDTIVVFSYEDHGNVRPKRYLFVPHQSWGISINHARDEIVVSVQQSNGIFVYRRQARGLDEPLRSIRGLHTELEDPHGIVYDGVNGEIVAANHGNWTQLRPYTPYDPLVSSKEEYRPGKFHPPSITMHAGDASGDAPPLRTIEGERTRLNWPMGIDVDTGHSEIAVANYGDSAVLIFRRTDRGDVAPLRIIRGAATGIVGPIGVAIDTKNDEIWVANYGDHTAAVFSRTANGDVKPKRIIRNAPVNTATCGFTNASAAAYDTKRGAILVPN